VTDKPTSATPKRRMHDLFAAGPLWDGVADIRVRQARPNEEARWRASRAKAIRHGNIEGEEEAWAAFLVALTDPSRR